MKGFILGLVALGSGIIIGGWAEHKYGKPRIELKTEGNPQASRLKVPQASRLKVLDKGKPIELDNTESIILRAMRDPNVGYIKVYWLQLKLDAHWQYEIDFKTQPSVSGP